jgi:hypothetical protein
MVEHVVKELDIPMCLSKAYMLVNEWRYITSLVGADFRLLQSTGLHEPQLSGGGGWATKAGCISGVVSILTSSSFSFLSLSLQI